MSELVTQDDPAVLFRPIESVFGQKNDRRERAPSEWSADDWTGKKVDLERDFRLGTGLGEESLPVRRNEWPRCACNAAQPNASDDEPGDDNGETKRPNHRQ